LVAIVGLLTACLARGRSDQAQVSADMFPIVEGARESAVFVDCSKVNALAYFPHNPCDTFVLLRSDQFASQQVFLAAEASRLRAAGWRHPRIAPPIDYDVGDAAAPLDQSWFAPGHCVCAYVATAAAAVAAEGQGLLPFDPYDNPHGMLDFYETARAAQSGRALWVRLRPPVMVQPGAC
jgi:hypothetical protein